MVTMTLREALRIQEQQIQFYGPRFAGGVEGLRATMYELTKLPEGVDLDAPRPSWECACVPRGADIERVMGLGS